MSDPFQYHSPGLDSPARHHALIVPSDSANLPTTPRALYCAAAGTAVLRDAAGTDLSYDLAQGDLLPLRAVRVLATGTTATLYGWW